MCDSNNVGQQFVPADPAPMRRRIAGADSRGAALSPRHPSLQGTHRFIAPAVSGDEDPPYFAGYLTQLSVAPGEPLSVHVASRSSAPCFVDVYRVIGCADVLLTPRLEHVERLGEVPVLRYPKLPGGRKLCPGEADSAGCRWPAHTVLEAVPESWDSGVYLVQFTAESQPTECSSALLGQDALLIVRPFHPGSETSLLCQVNVATWAAYHIWDNRSLYMGRTAEGSRYDELRVSRASFHRPGLGLGLPNETLLTPAPPKAAGVFAFVDWLSRKGIHADFCTGLDIGNDVVPLQGYRALITVGHDEYWTSRQRQRVQEYRNQGGHTVFLGGNLAYWEIRENAERTGIECYKNSGGGPCSAAAVTAADQQGQTVEPLDPAYPTLGTLESPQGIPRAEAEVEDENKGEQKILTSELWRCVEESTVPLTGVYMVKSRPGSLEVIQAGAAWWWEEFGGPTRPAVGFTVVEADHWVFAGTGLAEGESFGEAIRLVGHEGDGLEMDFVSGLPRLTMKDGALAGTTLLAYGDCRDWAEVDYSAWPPQSVKGRQLSCCAFAGCVTMIHRQASGEGMLFAAPVTDWVLCLAPSIDWSQHRDLKPAIRPPDPIVDAITWNVMRFCLEKN
jgi:hypothetical protein